MHCLYQNIWEEPGRTWHPNSFLNLCSYVCFQLTLRIQGKKKKEKKIIQMDLKDLILARKLDQWILVVEFTTS